MTDRKPRKRAYIPPSHEVVNKREPTEQVRTVRNAPRGGAAGAGGKREFIMEPPTWRRTMRRVPVYMVMIFAMQYFFTKGSSQERLRDAAISAAAITVAFLPMMFLMERWQYTRWLRKTGRVPGPSSASGHDAK